MILNVARVYAKNGYKAPYLKSTPHALNFAVTQCFAFRNFTEM